jgi:glycosyltransferase involved in cell wall biosynthesis
MTPSVAGSKGLRVLHLVKTGVGATWAVRLVREQVRSGIEVHVLVPDGPRAADYRAAGATVHLGTPDLSLRSPRLLRANRCRLREVVRVARPDILHSHFVGSTMLMRLAFGENGPPRVFQVPGPLHLEHTITAQAELAMASSRDHWIGSCQWTVDAYRRHGVHAERIGLAYYGTDIDHAAPVTATGALHALVGVPRDARLIGLVSYMYAPKRWLGQSRGLKGHEDLIDAFRLVHRTLPDTHLVMIGGAWAGASAYEAKVRGYAAGVPRVHFTGTQQDIATLYRDLALAVHPSHSENLGGAAESMLLGIPTIATRVGGFTDLVRDGETGWLVPPRDPQALAHVIGQALRDPQVTSRFAGAGRKHASRLLDVQRTAAQVTEAYRQFGLLH